MTNWVFRVQGSMEQAAVRLTAAAGLLRLARSHDEAVPVALFHRVALTLQVTETLPAWRPGCIVATAIASTQPDNSVGCLLQDPVLEVRRAVSEKLQCTVVRLQVKASTDRVCQHLICVL